jgi:hypothetical protein
MWGSEQKRDLKPAFFWKLRFETGVLQNEALRLKAYGIFS